MMDNPRLWAPLAWPWHHGWQEGLLLTVGPDGCWQAIEPAAVPPPDAEVLPGPVIPGMVNAHSHAFQRAFAGLAEHRSADHDDFWTWRERMYGVAGRLSAAQLQVIARQLYGELLLGGYTHVCEFHYLHHLPHNAPPREPPPREPSSREPALPGSARGEPVLGNPLAAIEALLAAAAEAGMGITLLPAAYERAGFFQPELQPGQRSFAMTVRESLAVHDALPLEPSVRQQRAYAAHSLRAVSLASLHSLAQALTAASEPIHLHAAEQLREVEDCVRATGRRPLELLAAEGLLDRRWWLVHATHTMPGELDDLAAAGAGLVLCPHTEANLGDGICDLPGMLARGVRIAIGSDSQIARDWPQELRQLEYAQRLRLRQRCVAAQPPLRPSTGERLLADTLAAGAQAAGFHHWGFLPGARADLLVIDTANPAFRGVPRHALIDCLIFASHGPVFCEVLAAGRWAVRHGKHPALSKPDFAHTMCCLWSDDAEPAAR